MSSPNLKISINWLKGVITVTALVAIGLRIYFPDLRIDSVTLGLMVVAILPWLSELIESAKFPGGWEIKFRDLQHAADKITSTSPTPAATSTPTPSPTPTPTPSASSSSTLSSPASLGRSRDDMVFLEMSPINFLEPDPNLALVGLRIEIERRLRQLAEKHGISTARRSLTGLVRDLKQRELLPHGAASGLDDLIMAGNRAAHGARVEPGVAEWAQIMGPLIILALDDLL